MPAPPPPEEFQELLDSDFPNTKEDKIEPIDTQSVKEKPLSGEANDQWCDQA